ncbi:hypothetical protein 20Sep418_00009 [Pseudomonas phage 20Sep418]|uniref:Uncharacterized protein n=7 Tax=Pakpunavirus TaxID=1921407 RepID=A0A9E6QA20_9CAUD|nr:hypothetical protein QE325_gp072 [Pseudomonas phage pPA-3099-2aT.2]YP_010763333.1 hypothetical protein QE329_gp169 [Pseudomonas phage PhL_UNISO_PA-DSM_ph0034]YP_010763660.1 hypothetical protein QE331_gp176 [Pseudomonas phage 20Sep416]YP_010765126.1 hypothetical protein QE347_gp018 [Pseudomonas phage vB_Paer_Ps12]YP_010765314.1 hypothetical protein QE348_gp018 [Pseudomonas phage vB_Paer_PsIn]YP_010765511.1 hypothetical protein QE349_gp018 [Pseudomonas phage vB_Paer_PsCh]UOL47662.1 hypotheti
MGSPRLQSLLIEFRVIGGLGRPTRSSRSIGRFMWLSLTLSS